MNRYFEFNEIKSVDMDYHIVYFKTDYFEKITYGGRSIASTLAKTPVITENPLEFTITLAKMDKGGNLLRFEQKDINELGRWLIKDEYKPIRFSDDMDKVYYVMLSEMSPLNLDKVENGYIEITFVANTSHAFTNERKNFYSVSDKENIEILGEHIIERKYYPTFHIKAKDKTDLKIHNLASGQEFILKDIEKNETIIVDNDLKLMKSDRLNSNPFKNFNRKWFWLEQGNNLIKIEGNVELTIISQYSIL